jgi:SWI/SNF-related matrix-associated actin-dependent regulator 1 of chromatin subfamily A
MAELFAYQKHGAAWLAQIGRGLLADEPGLGKTAQAIAAADEHMDSKLDMGLVVCPASVVANWEREIRLFAPWLAAQFTVVSYDKARTRDDLKRHEFKVLILDEAHFLKSKDAKRTQAILGKRCDGKGGLVERAEHVFLLTGTPMPNHPGELWPLLRAVMPDSIVGLKTGKPVAYWPFVMRYCRVENNYLGHPQIKGGKNLAELKKRIAPFYLRRKKSDVLPDLPELRTDLLALPAAAPADPGRELRVRDGDRGCSLAGSAAELVREALERGGIEALAAIAPHVATLRRLTGLAKAGPVSEWVADQLDGGLQKLVIFAVHREVVQDIRNRLYKRYGVAVIEGGTTDRQTQVDRFQNDPLVRVFIGQIQAAGTGITLTAASDLVFAESSWVPTDNEQAAMRIHRIGQRNACMVRFAMIPGSIDEQIAEACRRKLADIQAVFA